MDEWNQNVDDMFQLTITGRVEPSFIDIEFKAGRIN